MGGLWLSMAHFDINAVFMYILMYVNDSLSLYMYTLTKY